MRTLLSAVFGLALANIALAADPTDLPPNLRGDAGLGYAGSFEQAGLEENGAVYGIRNTLRHDLDFSATFTLYTGVALSVTIPGVVSESITYPAARSMLRDPLSGQGGYSRGTELDPTPEIKGKGIDGIWIGVALAPFREDYANSLPVTTRFDIAVRTPSASLYSEKRGVGSGGTAYKLAGAFSVVRGAANPYFSMAWIGETRRKVDVVSPDGTARGELSLRDASRLDAVAGAELVATQDNASGKRFAFDLHMTAGYRAWADRASGFWLPDTLENAKSVPVTQSDYVVVGAGLGVHVDFSRLVGVRLDATGTWATPHRIEHPYAISTDTQSFGVAWSAGVVGRFRTKDDRR